MHLDLIAARAALLDRTASAVGLLEASLAAARDPAQRYTFLHVSSAVAEATAQSTDRQLAAGAPLTPLAGLAVSVKDLFDVHGEVTGAASPTMADAPAAASDCPAVARLRQAGAALIGRTNMTEFAYSGVGINPHYGTPANAATRALDAAPRIPGGSTSGGAVSVASGAAWAALGSDTGGSIRIPAALQGIVGYKNTARLTPTEGAVPLSTTLDTASAMTRSVRDAILVHGILAARRPTVADRPLASLRLAVPQTLMLDTLEPAVARAFDAALAALRDGGARIEPIALPELAEVATINATGGFSAAESWTWHRARLARDAARYDPRVRSRIERGAPMRAADYIELLAARRDWIARVEAKLESYDACLSPTVPCIAPPIEPLLADDAAFFATNNLLLRNPAVINLLDGCAISLPCHPAGSWPVGLMLWSSALRDDVLLAAALAVEAGLARIRR